MRASIAKNRAGIVNIKIFMGGPSLRAFAEAGTKKNRTESPRSVWSDVVDPGPALFCAATTWKTSP